MSKHLHPRKLSRPPHRLPDLCLLAVFKQMSLTDRLQGSKVTTRWENLITETNQKVKSLTILNGTELKSVKPNDFYPYKSDYPEIMNELKTETGEYLYPANKFTEKNSLEINRRTVTDKATYCQITAIFNTISNLKIVFSGSPSENVNIVNMLNDTKWTQKLTTFAMYNNEAENGWSIDINLNTLIVKAINQMKHLKNLKIYSLQNLYVFPLPILRQLQSLTVAIDSYSFSRTDDQRFLRTLERYGETNDGLQMHLITSEAGKLNHLSDNLRSKIYRINEYIYGDDEVDDNEWTFETDFPSRISLEMQYFRPSQFQRMFSELSKLSLLEHLTLNISFTDQIEEEYKLKRPQTVLQTIKALELDLNITAHEQVPWLNLKNVMPNLKVIFVESFKCNSCHKQFNYHSLPISDPSSLSCLRSSLFNIHTDVPLNKLFIRTPAKGMKPIEHLF